MCSNKRRDNRARKLLTQALPCQKRTHFCVAQRPLQESQSRAPDRPLAAERTQFCGAAAGKRTRFCAGYGQSKAETVPISASLQTGARIATKRWRMSGRCTEAENRGGPGAEVERRNRRAGRVRRKAPRPQGPVGRHIRYGSRGRKKTRRLGRVFVASTRAGARVLPGLRSA